MAHFAELDDNNKVKQVIVVHNNELLDENRIEQEQKGIDFCVAHYGGRWVQTSFNASFRKNFAAVDGIYDPMRNAFIGPKYEIGEWVLNEDTCQWEEVTT
jgi:hypothetical protein